MGQRELVRVRHGKVIAGVCGGIARRFGWSPTLVRVAFVVSCVLPGPQVLAYLVLWALVPKEPEEDLGLTRESRR
ncbi:MAG: PspC domain-containing protein [Egibacteraceae bacterium]